MRRLLFAVGLALTLGASAAAETRDGCQAHAHNRRVAGTALGAVGGGLLGSALAGHGARTEGALLGAGAGAVVGNQASRVSCDRHAVDHTRAHHSARTAPPPSAPAPANYAAAAPVAAAITRAGRTTTRPGG